ncbi:fasciclin domain-containing protein [Litoribacter populi]|uniref:fasciclin domain-containing protein n=1 Tax=Litoribacter populi TaxID=2598460 RepID=UPI00117D1221|nr:fasciclin domain-containing protein [Litoribacter populi]
MNNLTNLIRKISLSLLLAFLVSFAGVAQVNTTTDTQISEVDENELSFFNDISNKENHDVLSLIKKEEKLSIFAELLEKSGIEPNLSNGEEFTVFAPTNDAFERLSVEEYNSLLEDENSGKLLRLVRAHIVPQKIYMSNFDNNQVLGTEHGEEISVDIDGAVTPAGKPTTVLIGGASILTGDIDAENGVIHIMDDVITLDELADPIDRK